MFKKLLFCAILAVSLIGFGCSLNTLNEAKKEVTPTVEAAPTPPANKEPITIAAGGDIMLGSPVPRADRFPPNDGADSLKAVAPIFQKADIAFGNMEGPIVDSGVSGKCGAGSAHCFAFRMPTRYAKYLKEAGFDVMSVANNHAGDFGEAGRASTRKVLEEQGIKHCGTNKGELSMTILEVKGKKIAFVGFAHNSTNPNVNDLDLARNLVEQATKADIVVVSFHGGAEGSNNTHVPQRTEIFFGEARGNLPLFAKTVIDAGADLVLGHGPHVLRGMEVYKDRLIAYSLGNFATYGQFQLSGPTAETMVLEVTLDSEGKFVSGKINPFVLRDKGILTADSSKSAISTIRNLSKSDFPNSAPSVADDGTITKEKPATTTK
jgi:poly-gamma-glutamate capsule biosynthesis protein CapA/YwtB (metallophosphatase superfamily)